MQTVRRNTEYAAEIKQIISQLHHASNQQIIDRLRQKFPEVSATTVHRVTQRLADDGVTARAPMTRDGCLRYDANILPHDHFECMDCGRLRDITVPQELRLRIEGALGGCRLTGQLVINGSCYGCEYHQT